MCGVCLWGGVSNGFAQSVSSVPQWARDAVWYQIFPERFRNGDTSNDPTPEHIHAPAGWKISPWTGDWYQRAAWEQRVGPSFYNFVFDRRYGGDMQGIIDELDYLKDLGVTAIYLNPVQDAVSLHKYDASYYHHMDRFFGPNPKEDEALMGKENNADPSKWVWTSADSLFLKLVKEVHKRGMKVIIDGVFNHTGTDFWAFKDLVKNQQNSPYKNWYIVKSFDDPSTPDTNEFDYEGWWGYKGLPVWRKENGTIVKPVRDIIFADTRRWMDPNGDGDPSDGIDGWRLDVAEEIGHNFWKEWHKLVRSINPNAYTTAEIWSRNAIHYVKPDEFSAVMNYRFTRAVHRFFIQQNYTATQLDTSLTHIRDDYSTAANEGMMNLMDSHDTERLASMIVNKTHDFKEKSHVPDGFKVRKPNAQEREVQKLIALFQFTYVGSPMVYYGDEAGMWGADDPDDRKPMVWPDMTYDDEVNQPFSQPRPRDKVSFDSTLFNWYKMLAHIRDDNPVLGTGAYKTIRVDDQNKVFCFARYDERGNVAYVLINRGDKDLEISIDTRALGRKYRHRTYQNVIDNNRISSRKGIITLNIRAVSGDILISQ